MGPHLVLEVLEPTWGTFVYACAIWSQQFLFIITDPSIMVLPMDIFMFAYLFSCVWHICVYVHLRAQVWCSVHAHVCGDQKLTSECSVTTLHLSF